jgi:hypothetical protein
MYGERAPWTRRSETHLRKIHAQVLYDLEMECRRRGWGADPAFVHDEERELFRFRDGRFAISCEHAEWALLKKSRIKE